MRNISFASVPFFLEYCDKDTTVLRLVFDAKAKDRSGRLMNGAIEKGPNRLNDFFQIL